MKIELSQTLTSTFSRQEFWDHLKVISSTSLQSASKFEQTISDYIKCVSASLNSHLESDEDLTRCSYLFIQSNAFSRNKAYARRKIISTFIQNTSQYSILTILGAILLLDGRHNDTTFEMMEEEDAMPVLISTIRTARSHSVRLHRIFLELLYEMCRIQKLTIADLALIDSDFVNYLFGTIESKFGYDYDPYSFAVIKVFLALNEQFMVAAYEKPKVTNSIQTNAKDTNHENISSEGSADQQGAGTNGKFADHDEASLSESLSAASIDDLKPEPMSSQQNSTPARFENIVFKTLVQHKDKYRAFGENIVFLLNRSPDNNLQLMVLKLLYLIFTTPATYEYLYLNDLKVIVDVFIRELYNLPVEEENLIHTYLRVLHPLLLHTELRNEKYKREEIVGLLEGMSDDADRSCVIIGETTQRLAYRCLFVDWLSAPVPKIRKHTTLQDSLRTSHGNSSVPLLSMKLKPHTFDGVFSSKHKHSNSHVESSNSKLFVIETKNIPKVLKSAFIQTLPQQQKDQTASANQEQESINSTSQSSRSSASYDQEQETEDTILTPISTVSTSFSDKSSGKVESEKQDLKKSTSFDSLNCPETNSSVLCADEYSNSPFSNPSSTNSTTTSLHEVYSSPIFGSDGTALVFGKKLPPLPSPPPAPPSRTKALQKPRAASTNRPKPPPPPPSSSLEYAHPVSPDPLSTIKDVTHKASLLPPPPPAHRLKHSNSSEHLKISDLMSLPLLDKNTAISASLLTNQRRESSPIVQPLQRPPFRSFHSSCSSTASSESRTLENTPCPSPLPPVAPPSRGKVNVNKLDAKVRTTSSQLPPPPPPSRLHSPKTSAIGMSIRNSSVSDLATSRVLPKKSADTCLSRKESVNEKRDSDLSNDDDEFLSDITDDSWLSDGEVVEDIIEENDISEVGTAVAC